MNTKLKIKQIQLLGSTFISGYFSFAELVNYNQFNQHKIIKRFEKGGGVQNGKFGEQCLNVVKQDDTVGDIFIRYGLGGDLIKSGYYYSNRPTVIPVPFDFKGYIYLVRGLNKVYNSTNKSYSKYIITDTGSSIWIGNDLTGFAMLSKLSSDDYRVCYIDMVINTTEPITFNYAGEAEFIQNSNIDNNFTPLFKINCYDYNCF